MTGGVRLLRRLVLEERQSLPDGSGGFAVSWQPRGTLWADITSRAGREDFAGGRVRPRVSYRILVRSAPIGSPSRPNPEQRLREGTRVFDILTVAEHDAGGRYLEITAQEGILP